PARVRIVDTEKPESAVDREARAPSALSSHRIARDLHDARSDREVQKGHCVFESLTGGEGALGRLRKRSIRRNTHFRRVAARTVRGHRRGEGLHREGDASIARDRDVERCGNGSSALDDDDVVSRSFDDRQVPEVSRIVGGAADRRRGRERVGDLGAVHPGDALDEARAAEAGARESRREARPVEQLERRIAAAEECRRELAQPAGSRLRGSDRDWYEQTRNTERERAARHSGRSRRREASDGSTDERREKEVARCRPMRQPRIATQWREGEEGDRHDGDAEQEPRPGIAWTATAGGPERGEHRQPDPGQEIRRLAGDVLGERVERSLYPADSRELEAHRRPLVLRIPDHHREAERERDTDGCGEPARPDTPARAAVGRDPQAEPGSEQDSVILREGGDPDAEPEDRPIAHAWRFVTKSNFGCRVRGEHESEQQWSVGEDPTRRTDGEDGRKADHDDRPIRGALVEQQTGRAKEQPGSRREQGDEGRAEEERRRSKLARGADDPEGERWMVEVAEAERTGYRESIRLVDAEAEAGGENEPTE